MHFGDAGKLFHVDFGYILGRDPKPMPPPMKLSKEMVEGMGGPNSEQFQQFKQITYTAFLALRRYTRGADVHACSHTHTHTTYMHTHMHTYT